MNTAPYTDTISSSTRDRLPLGSYIPFQPPSINRGAFRSTRGVDETLAMSDIRQKVFRVPENVVVSVGLCWSFKGADPVDLDLSASCFTKEGKLIDVVFFNHLFPEGTDAEPLRQEYLVDPELLPYMFLSGDSRLGGEEENQLPGTALAARRRKQLLGSNDMVARTAAEAVFNRLYAEEELRHVQDAMDDVQMQGGDIYDEDGRQVHRMPRRELCDEVLTFVMEKIPAQAEVIFLSISSYTGQDFTTLPKVYLVIYNETTNVRVGTIDLKASTGTGTANLGCMLMRLSSPSAGADGEAERYWDLRELNVRTFGYSFVDLFPLMQDVLGIPESSRLYALENLPDYSLRKDKAGLIEQPLSDVRFGVGWDGEHDCDAFLVMLDSSHNYVDHIYPKCGKLRSVAAGVARHSGDSHSGASTVGDEEFIDLMSYRVPPNVATILVGATHMESYGAQKHKCRTIYDVPNLYLRIQNRTVTHPYSFEVDRWNVHGAVGAGDAKSQYSPTYQAADKSMQPVRCVLLGVMVKRGTVPFEGLFPDGRRLDQHYHRDGSGHAGPSTAILSGQAAEAGPEDEVPFFEFTAIHQPIPVNPRGCFTSVIPFLQAVATYVGGRAGSGAVDAPSGTSPQRRLDTRGNSVGWDHLITTAVGGHEAQVNLYRDIWDQVTKSNGFGERFALEVTFLEVLQLEPQLPDKFRCHGEAWVYGHSPLPGEGNAENRPHKTPYLVERHQLVWSRPTSGLFLVNPYDRIRVVLYEHASMGFADVELLPMPELWDANNKSSGQPLDINIRLGGGGHLYKGEVKIRLRRTPYSAASQRLQKAAAKEQSRHQSHAIQQQERLEEIYNEEYTACAVM